MHKKEHKCGEIYCKICKDFFEVGHLCFMLPVVGDRQQNLKGTENTNPDYEDTSMTVEESDTKRQIYIFFDFECTQDDLLECADGYQPGDSGSRTEWWRKTIDQYRVDGYYETGDGEKVVLEYHGCFWHGCPKCYTQHTINTVNKFTMADLYHQTMEKKTHIEKQGYKYNCIWECEFDKNIRDDRNTKTFIDSIDIVTPLEPSDAFAGGMTEAFKLYHESTMGESIKYYDVTSLHPYIYKTRKAVIGHPKTVTENFDDLATYEGLIKCKICPTPQARLKLYSYLEKLGPRVMYADTDSVVFTVKEGEWEPPLGDYLGDLTDEVPSNNIKHFVTDGPKNYAYKLENPDSTGIQTVSKVRRITMNYKNALSINFDTVRDLVTSVSEDNVITVVDENKICRDQKNARIITNAERKDNKIVFDKRVIVDSNNTKPYGY
ncbi:unnamed protein product [Mytilus coruscus]|uniref:DNA-directed DNA polymerase n=1 Tax=Mytilus coruscus TaxID=42192 RepID=A0A6J8BSD7_MYTCO|nr:unnamed protein product [Mytilus coruscus]